MALTSTAFTRPRLAATTSESITLSQKSFDNGTYSFIDFYATVNAQLRLLWRVQFTPTYQGSSFSIVPTHLSYAALAASTYDPTDVSSALTTFTIAAGVEVVAGGTIDIDALYTTAGDSRT